MSDPRYQDIILDIEYGDLEGKYDNSEEVVFAQTLMLVLCPLQSFRFTFLSNANNLHCHCRWPPKL